MDRLPIHDCSAGRVEAGERPIEQVRRRLHRSNVGHQEQAVSDHLEDAPDAFWPKHAGDWWWRRLSATTAEPLADLREMPIPGRVGSLIGAAPADRATAANLLAAVLAAPGSLVHRDVEAVFLFAAARVVAFPGSDFTCEAAPIDWNVWRDRDKRGDPTAP